ncbi:flavin reductase family protein [Nocardioides sp. BP30]|uniref:flavin reductase family protein n=1 Tax=Nocardioides sp. BP30 TaxID=3036374 RepID=UPI0024683865|nr:flavin reductase family protein [Nocardioides sp. BP30]WGL53972.1 flavin reductase family protein [Nocardioides sp. BP30]
MIPLASLPAYDDDTTHLRRIFSYFPSGVVVLAADVEGEVEGMVASSFTVGVSLDPPLVLCAIQRTSSTWPRLRAATTLGVSVLAEDHGGIGQQVASRERSERFAGVPLRSTGGTARFIAGAPVWFECTVHAEHEAGDHLVVLLEVGALGADPNLKPLVFHASTFRRLVHPTSEETPS